MNPNAPNCAATNRTREAAAFTRTEALAVLAAVALLGVTVYAALRQWQHQSQRQACLRRLQVLSQGLQAFAFHDGRFPQAARKNQPKPLDWVHWQLDRDFEQSALAQYCPDWNPDLLVCPLDQEPETRAFPFSFALNGNAERSGRQEMGPAGRILLAEQSRPNDGCWGAGLDEEPLTRRHQDAAGVAFADGHVQFIQTDPIKRER